MMASWPVRAAVCLFLGSLLSGCSDGIEEDLMGRGEEITYNGEEPEGAWGGSASDRGSRPLPADRSAAGGFGEAARGLGLGEMPEGKAGQAAWEGLGRPALKEKADEVRARAGRLGIASDHPPTAGERAVARDFAERAGVPGERLDALEAEAEALVKGSDPGATGPATGVGGQ
ncbi:MAG: hypothetical protein HQL57_06860 [Magnetococcales bacterium]|nr:hypothetical protein [Magnetococcales bacterium]MBF0156890.1 hypothetical protein [Magnetococcales bacterium]